MSKQLEAVVSIAGSLSPSLEKSIKGATDKLNGLNLKAIAIGAAVGAATVAATKAMVDFAKESIEAAASYETAFAAASTLMQGTEEEIRALSDDIIKTSNETGIAAEDLANSVYSAISAGIAQEDAVEFAGKAARLAAAGFTDVDTALSATAKTLNAYGMSAEQADEIQKVLIQTQNLGITTVDELGASLAQVTPTAAAFGVSFEQVGASLAVMTAQGTPTAQATTQLNGLIAELGKNGTVAANNLMEAAEGTKFAGMSFSEMMDSGATLGDVLELLQEKADASGVSMVDMFSSIEAGKAALAIFSGEGETFREDLLAMATDADVVGEAYDKVTGTYEHQIEVLKNLGQNAKISFGQRLLPIVTKVAKTAIPMLENAIDKLLPVFDNLADNLQPIVEDLLPKVMPLISELLPPVIEMASALASELIPPIAEIVASIIPVLIQMIQMLTPILQTIITTILPVIVRLIQKLLPILLNIISAVLPVITQLLETLLPVIGQIIDAVLPVVIELLETLLPVVMQIIETVLPVIVSLLNTIIPIVLQIIEAVLPILIEVLNILTPILDQIIALLNPILDLFVMLIEPILNLIMTAIQPLIDIFTVLITSILQPVMPILSAVAEVITGVLGSAIQAIAPIVEGLTGVFQGLIDFITGVFSGNWSQAWNGVVQVFGGLWESLVGIVKAPINAVIGLINGAIRALNKVSVTIPDWVPVVGGKSFGINIPTIPLLAAGGFTDGISIAGEAGTEAVISFDRAYRSQNLNYWMEAGERLDAFSALTPQEESYTAQAGKLVELDNFSLNELSQSTNGPTVIYDFSGFTWSPTVEGSGGSNDDLMAMLREHEAEFFDWLEEFIRMREVSSFA